MRTKTHICFIKFHNSFHSGTADGQTNISSCFHVVYIHFASEKCMCSRVWAEWNFLHAFTVFVLLNFSFMILSLVFFFWATDKFCWGWLFWEIGKVLQFSLWVFFKPVLQLWYEINQLDLRHMANMKIDWLIWSCLDL